jgi:hypothetical protein
MFRVRNNSIHRAGIEASTMAFSIEKASQIYFIVVLQLFLVLLPVSLSAQSKKELFEQCVDRFNFTTIGYVLADDKQKPEARQLAIQLEDLQSNPDTLIQRIIGVYGPNSKTQILSATINNFKNKFVDDRSLSRQLADVSKFIREDRKGKTYLPHLEKDLQTIEEETVAKTAALSDKDHSNVQVKSASLTTASVKGAAELPASQEAEVPAWLTLLVGVIGLVSLANLFLFYKLVQKRRTAFYTKDDSHRTVYQVRDFEIYPRIEKNTEALERKIEDLRKEVMALMGEKKEEPVAIQRVPELPKQPIAVPVAIEQKEPIQKAVAPAAIVAPGRVVELQVNKPAISEVPKSLKKYADYPKENGFVMSQLQDSSDRRSIYEITIPPDSDYAQFTIVDNKELHEYAIQNRERLLKDACDFEVSSSQHTKIEVLRPGKLQKNGNIWQIRHKAQIKFV